MVKINKPSQPLIPPTDVEEVEQIAANAAEAAIAADDTHAPLVDDKVPAEHLPSYVDDVLNFGSVEDFPEEGEEGKIYVANDTNNTYRWTGTTYVQVGGSEIDLTPYALKTEVAGKQDKPYKITLNTPETMEPTERGYHIAGSFSADQVSKIREYYPNLSLGGIDGVDGEMGGFPSPAGGWSGDNVLVAVAWHQVQYENFPDPNKKVLSCVAVNVDLETATYTMDVETIPSESEGGSSYSVPHISITTEQTSGTLPAADLASLNNADSADAVIEVVLPGEETSMDIRDVYRVYTRGYDTIRAINVNPEHNIGITINRQTGEWTFVAIASKQDTLVSGTNIKTINTQSVLGSGDLEITLSQSAQTEVQSMIDAAIGNVLNQEF